MLLSRRCPLCRRPGPAPCAACIGDLVPAGRRPPPMGVDSCHALLAYVGAGRRLVAGIKYRNRRDGLRWVALGMAALVSAAGAEVVTWVPTTRSRRWSRGFDHAQLLATEVGRQLGLPVVALLCRAPGPPQTGLGREARLRGPQFTTRRAVPGAVVVVDDVITSGATMSAAAWALRAGGARRVAALAAASTPRHVRRQLKVGGAATDPDADGPFTPSGGVAEPGLGGDGLAPGAG